MFLDAPHVLSPADIASSFNTPEELGASEAAEVDPALQPRGWWKADPERKQTIGIEASVTLLRDVLQKDRYVVSYQFPTGAGPVIAFSDLRPIQSVLQGVFGFR